MIKKEVEQSHYLEITGVDIRIIRPGDNLVHSRYPLTEDGLKEAKKKLERLQEIFVNLFIKKIPMELTPLRTK